MKTHARECTHTQPGAVAHTCSPNAQEAKAGRPQLHRDLEDSLDYRHSRNSKSVYTFSTDKIFPNIFYPQFVQSTDEKAT